MSGIFAFFIRDIQVLEDRIDHRVAGHGDFIILNTFVQEMLPRSPGRGEEQVRDRIRDHPVDLFGHRPVKTHEASLHMTDPDGELRGSKRTGKSVSTHDHEPTGSGGCAVSPSQAHRQAPCSYRPGQAQCPVVPP